MSTQTFDESQHPRETTGRFATKAVDEAEGGLAALSPPERPAKDWGELNVRVGSRTPWGGARVVRHIAPGIAEVSCAQHGGVKLSPQRNGKVPKPLRRPSGWYEEDCEWAIVARQFPDEFAAHRRKLGSSDDWTDPDKVRAYADATTKNWFPDQYEAATHTVVGPEESTVRAEAMFRRDHMFDHVAVAASRHEADRSFVEVTATLGGRRDEPKIWDSKRMFLVPADEYDGRDRLGFVIDPERHRDITPPPPPPKPKAERRRSLPTTERATPAARARIRKDLASRWRRQDGSVSTLAEIIETEGLTHKETMGDGETGRSTYYLCQAEHVGASSATVYKVTKATWDATKVPDTPQ